MEAAPDLAHGTLDAHGKREAPLRAAAGLCRSTWWTRMTGWQSQAVLVALVLVLGLLQGTRTALGRPSLASPPAVPDVAAPPAREADWRRGDFFRPAGSTAARPRLVLRPSEWRPLAAPRVARACPPRTDGSC